MKPTPQDAVAKAKELVADKPHLIDYDADYYLVVRLNENELWQLAEHFYKQGILDSSKHLMEMSDNCRKAFCYNAAEQWQGAGFHVQKFLESQQ